MSWFDEKVDRLDQKVEKRACAGYKVRA